MLIRLKQLCLILFLIALSVVATIYLAWLLYPLEITWLNLEGRTYLTGQTIAYNFNQLLAYLTQPWVGQLEMANFSSSASGLKHFADVKFLFQLAQLVLLLTAYPSLTFLRGLSQKQYWALYRNFFRNLLLAPWLIFLAGFLMGFEAFFTLFHQVLFPGDSSWLFDPLTDPVINILPADFFLHCFLLFLVIYQLIGLTWWLKSGRASKPGC